MSTLVPLILPRDTDDVYFVNALITFAEMWRKNMDPMNESDRTRTMKGSLGSTWVSIEMPRHDKRLTPEALGSRPCRVSAWCLTTRQRQRHEKN